MAAGSAEPAGRQELVSAGGHDSLGDSFDRTMRGARRGRGRAWDALYGDLSPLVLGYLRARRVPDAEDVCAETFLQVVRDLDRFEGDEANLRSWVLTIAHHRSTDARRRAARRPSDPTPDDTLERCLPAAAGVEATALATLGTDEVLALLDRLSDDQREVLLLRLLVGMSATEIAELTERSREAVKALQKRGIAKLREVVTPETHGVDPGPARGRPAALARDERSADAPVPATTPPPPSRGRER
ncbi:sigma-70 family RNA polymerase sigma factor [Nitriliruptoraceae bacterium ZYF776]|nr:sigma-70 family RNA polymerase sigma factor [Profundirhabdus halotolerans]